MYNQLNQVRHPAGADVVLVISDAVFVSLLVVKKFSIKVRLHAEPLLQSLLLLSALSCVNYQSLTRPPTQQSQHSNQ